MSQCKGCGKEIVWAETRAGKKIPLDPKPPVFKVVRDLDRVYGQMVSWADLVPGGMVSHFATCPKANDFSASNKDKKEIRDGMD